MKKLSIFVLSGLFLLASVVACTTTKNTGTKPVKEEKSSTAGAEKKAEVDLASSKINWKGTKPDGSHTGTLSLKSGSVTLKGNELIGGEFVIDMGSINNTDMEGGMKKNLEKHLMSADFFDSANHPEATFKITKVEGGNISGTVKVRGVEQNIVLPAKIEVKDGKLDASTTPFVVPRALWDGVFENKLDDVVIEDGIQIDVVIKTK